MKTSVAMILGIPTILLIVRTVLPSNGLLILVGKYYCQMTQEMIFAEILQA